jgi:hypothetical protein
MKQTIFVITGDVTFKYNVGNAKWVWHAGYYFQEIIRTFNVKKISDIIYNKEEVLNVINWYEPKYFIDSMNRQYRENSVCAYKVEILWEFKQRFPKIINIEEMYLNREDTIFRPSKNDVKKMTHQRFFKSDRIKSITVLPSKEVVRLTWLLLSKRLHVCKDIRLKISKLL